MYSIVKRNEGKKIDLWGDSHIIKLTSEDTGGQLSVIEQIYQTGCGSSFHKHNSDSHLIYILEGVFEFELESVLSFAEKGDVVFISAMTMHRFEVKSDNAGHLLVVTLPAGLEQLFVELSNHSNDSEEIQRIIAQFGIRLG